MLKSGAEPYEVLMLLACCLWSVSALVGLAIVPSTTTRDLPLWGVYMFFAGLGLGSGLALSGIAAERVYLKLSGFHVERAAQCALVGLSIGYSIWAVSQLGRASVAFVLLLAVIWGGGAFRIWRITRDLRAAQEPAP